MGKTVRLGVIGLGSVSEKYVPHIRALNLEGNDCQVVIGCDIRPGKAERARAWGIPAFTTNADEVIHHKDVDAVVILTDMQSHGGITRKALLAGKHVLVEKPMSMDLAEAAELVQLARTAKGHLVCAPHVTLSHLPGDVAAHRGGRHRPAAVRPGDVRLGGAGLGPVLLRARRRADV